MDGDKLFEVEVQETNGEYQYIFHKVLRVKREEDLDRRITQMLSQWYAGEGKETDRHAWEFFNGQVLVTIRRVEQIRDEEEAKNRAFVRMMVI